MCLAVQGFSRAASYYVDATEGSDTNMGNSPTAPWRSMARVNAHVFHPGDSILFKRGRIWREQLIISSSGREGDPILYGAYGTSEAKPIINGADLFNHDHWDAEGQNVWSKPNHISFSPEIAGSETAQNRFVVTIDGQRFLPVEGVQALREQTYTYHAESDRLFVYLTSDPDGHQTESAARCRSIDMRGVSHVVVRDLEVMNSVCNNIFLHGCKSIVITQITSHHAGLRGVLIEGDIPLENPEGWAEHITIEESFFYDHGIRCDTAAMDIGIDSSARYVTVRKCRLLGDGKHWGVDGIQMVASSHGAGHLIEENRICDHCENEIDVKGHFLDTVGGPRTVIKNNVLAGSGEAVVILHFGARRIDILKNVICFGRYHGLSLYNNVNESPYDGLEGDITIAYNIISDNAYHGIMDGGFGTAKTAGHNRIYHNVVVRNGRYCDCRGITFESSNWEIWNNIVWNNFDGSMEHQLMPVGMESHRGLVMGHNLIGIDPLFVDPHRNDFHLRADSPAIDAGADLGYMHDIDGDVVPYGEAPDIGVDEYTPGGPAVRANPFVMTGGKLNGGTKVMKPRYRAERDDAWYVSRR